MKRAVPLTGLRVRLQSRQKARPSRRWNMVVLNGRGKNFDAKKIMHYRQPTLDGTLLGNQ
jgi:hypothetical protein